MHSNHSVSTLYWNEGVLEAGMILLDHFHIRPRESMKFSGSHPGQQRSFSNTGPRVSSLIGLRDEPLGLVSGEHFRKTLFLLLSDIDSVHRTRMHPGDELFCLIFL